MTNSSPLVLAVGATGHFAGLVVPALAQRGAKVRGLIREAKQGAQVRQHGATEVAIGDLRDRDSMDAALRGVDAVFYLAPVFIPDEAKLGQDMVAAAQAAGVRRFVFSSVIHPTLSALVNHRAKGPVEEAIVTSGMEYAILQPALFFQNLAQDWSKVVQSGVFAEPWSTETRFSRVDYRDVAEVAALALTQDRLLGGTYELCAGGQLNRHDVAQIMSEVLGRHVEAAQVSTEQALSSAPDDATRTPLRRMFEWYDHHGLVGNSLTLHAILGREPRTLRAYLGELASQP